MKQKLSHSAITTFNECGFKYKLHYRDKLRPTTMGSPLFFGSAIDAALTYALQQFPTPDKRLIKDIFLKAWNDGKINDVAINIPYSKDILYSNTDFDEELLTTSDKKLIKLKRFYEIKENKVANGYQSLSDEDKLYFNYANWSSLREKGFLMIDAFFEHVLPNIKGVVSSQEEISLENTNGDKVTGFVDAVLKWKDYKQPIIFDFKTSGRPYKSDAVVTSPQLSLYKHSLSSKYNTSTAGYIVFIKTINKNTKKVCSQCEYDGSGARHDNCNNKIDGKRCEGKWIITHTPSINLQVLIDDIKEEFENKVLEDFDVVNTKLQQEIFDKNFKSCFGKFGPCIYRDYCHKGSTDGLIKK